MNQRILYNFASRSRPIKFVEAILNIMDYSEGDNAFIIAKIDNDDPCHAEYMSISRQYDSRYKMQVLFNAGYSQSKVHAINRGLTTMYGAEIIVNMSDDMRFLAPGFDNIIRQHCGPDDFVHFPDGHVDRRLCTMSIMGVDYYNRDGHIYHPSYKSLWCDNEAQDVARSRGRYKYVNQQIFEHQHPANGFGQKDNLLEHTESFHDMDKQNYRNRRRARFPK